MMLKIIQKHFPETDAELAQKCLQLFYKMRNLGLERAPATRELLSWLKYLNTYPKEEALNKITTREGLGVLIKTQPDLAKVRRMV